MDPSFEMAENHSCPSTAALMAWSQLADAIGRLGNLYADPQEQGYPVKSRTKFSLPESILRVTVSVEKDSDIDADVDTVVREAISRIFWNDASVSIDNFDRVGRKDNEGGKLSILRSRPCRQSLTSCRLVQVR